MADELSRRDGGEMANDGGEVGAPGNSACDDDRVCAPGLVSPLAFYADVTGRADVRDLLRRLAERPTTEL